MVTGKYYRGGTTLCTKLSGCFFEVISDNGIAEQTARTMFPKII